MKITGILLPLLLLFSCAPRPSAEQLSHLQSQIDSLTNLDEDLSLLRSDINEISKRLDRVRESLKADLESDQEIFEKLKVEMTMPVMITSSDKSAADIIYDGVLREKLANEKLRKLLRERNEEVKRLREIIDGNQRKRTKGS